MGACCLNRSVLNVILKDTPELTGRSSKYMYSAQLTVYNPGATSVKKVGRVLHTVRPAPGAKVDVENEPETKFKEDATSVLYPSFRVSFHQRTGFRDCSSLKLDVILVYSDASQGGLYGLRNHI